jgi:hypothetical protein
VLLLCVCVCHSLLRTSGENQDDQKINSRDSTTFLAFPPAGCLTMAITLTDYPASSTRYCCTVHTVGKSIDGVHVTSQRKLHSPLAGSYSTVWIDDVRFYTGARRLPLFETEFYTGKLPLFRRRHTLVCKNGVRRQHRGFLVVFFVYKVIPSVVWIGTK